MNVVKVHIRMSVETLLQSGVGLREVARRLNVDRGTVRRIERKLVSKTPTPATGSEEDVAQKHPPLATGSEVQNEPKAPLRPPAFAGEKQGSQPKVSGCAPHREWITAQVDLGRNATAIYQDLVEQHGFAHKYNAVKRFVRGIKVQEPERFDVLEFLPGEEAQVDYGQGALTLQGLGKYKRPYLFVMTLKYSGKSFRKVVWKTSQEIWAKLHEEAFRAFGGCPRFVVLDNLKEGVIKPHLYEPELNKVYAAMLGHYGVIGQPCRVRDPNRKGSVESAIQHTQSTALKGRLFETLDKQNEWLAHWEERWAAPRIHGRKKRQVMAMYLEEKPHLQPLPAAGFRCFVEEERKVDDAGLIQVKGSYYSALPAHLYTPVRIRIYDDEIVILNEDGGILRRHARTTRKGIFAIAPEDRIFNPSRETARLLDRIAKIGPEAAALAQRVFTHDGRAGHGVIYGLSALPKHYSANDIDAACAAVNKTGRVSYGAVKALLERRAKQAQSVNAPPPIDLRQQGSDIRPTSDYQQFWERNAQINTEEETNDGYVYN